MERAVAAIQNISESTLKALERQRTIVKALIAFAANTETSNIKERTVKLMQPELPKFHNTEERREWLENYKDWGVWYTDSRIGVTYYKYEFPDATILIAEEYKSDYSKYGNAFFTWLVDQRKGKRTAMEYLDIHIMNGIADILIVLRN